MTEEVSETETEWDAYESEVSHYYFHEPGIPSPGLDIEGRVTGYAEPKPPSFPSGADYYVMVTVLDRLAEADRVMPFVAPRFETRTGYERCTKCLERAEMNNPEKPVVCKQGFPFEYALQVSQGRPSASMVLGAAYGVQAVRFERLGEPAQELLKRAREAYREAALRVPFRKRPNRKNRLNRMWDIVFRDGAKNGQ